MTKNATTVEMDASIAKTQNTHFQEVYSAINPERKFPKTAPNGAPAPYAAKAKFLVFPGGIVCPMIPKAVGTLAAAPRPWRPLKRSKDTSLGAKGTAIETIVNQNEPAKKMSRFPYTSAILPQSNRKHPKVKE